MEVAPPPKKLVTESGLWTKNIKLYSTLQYHKSSIAMYFHFAISHGLNFQEYTKSLPLNIIIFTFSHITFSFYQQLYTYTPTLTSIYNIKYFQYSRD